MFWLNLSRIQIMWKCRFTLQKEGQLWGRGRPAGRVAKRKGGESGSGQGGWRVGR